jgi:hypothetical protein
MSQGYHTNAKTNSHSREIIQQSTLTNSELSQRFEITEKTVSKWKINQWGRTRLMPYLFPKINLEHNMLFHSSLVE